MSGIVQIIDNIVQIINNNPGKTIIVFLIFMGIAVVCELNSISKKSFTDYKPIIISIGILGTFVGIFCGLWDFNTNKDEVINSVPSLLEGLKMAFITSILGMFISILMSFYENNKKEEIDNGSSDNPSIKILKDILTEQKKANQETYSMLSSIQNSNKNVLIEQKTANEKTDLIISSIKDSHENININFNKVDESLKKALEVLSKGATEEIITALEKVISDFNKNLTDQFGDNFKQLNESVKQMIVWQENYKKSIEEIEKSLQLSLSHTEKTADYTEKFATNYEKISIATQDLNQIIETNQNQINDIETHLKSLKKIGDDASLITASMEDFSKSIQGSLSNQSEGLNQMSKNLTEEQQRFNEERKKLNEELGKSLGKLDENLASLTDKFRKDYDIFLENIKKFLGTELK